MLDLAGPAGAFEAANDRLESPAYRLHVLAADKGAVTSSLGVAITAASLDDAVLDTLVVTGGRIDPLLSAGTLSHIVETSRRCRRVVSGCTGAFALAAAGLLDGRRAFGGGDRHEPAPVQPRIPGADGHHARACGGTAPRRSGPRPHRDDCRTCRTHRGGGRLR